MHPNNIIVWPAFSSTTADHGLALGHATRSLQPQQAAVVFKVYGHCHPLRAFSYFPADEEMLYRPNRCGPATEAIWGGMCAQSRRPSVHSRQQR
eukprot:3263549-Prymnesium_polylepis.1